MEKLSYEFENTLLTLDEYAVQTFFQEAMSGLPPIKIGGAIIAPAPERIGKAWEEGTVTLSQVYMSVRIGGGFILADTHGEIPWQVSDEILHAISGAAHRWGTYPLKRASDYEG